MARQPPSTFRISFGMEKKINLVIGFLLFFSTVYSGTIEKDSVLKHLPQNFNGQVYIKQHDAILLNHFQGFSNRIYGTKINDSTLFNVGEVSHSFINYFIMHLASVNQIKITDKVSKYIKEFPYENIKISHLVHHQSGLPESYVRFYYKKKYRDMDVKLVDKAVRFDNHDIIELLSKKKPSLLFSPGDSIVYSDLNYLLLTSLIEKVTFTPYKDFVKRLFQHQHFVFHPVVSEKSDTIARKAYGYQQLQDSTIKFCDNLNDIGFDFSDGTNGNQHLYLSAKNLALWGQFLFKEMDDQIIAKNNHKRYYGNFQYNKKTKAIESIGAFGGTYSYLMYLPENKINIAITNSVMGPNVNYEKLIEYLRTLDNR